jgi:hypothetical protein
MSDPTAPAETVDLDVDPSYIMDEVGPIASLVFQESER